MSKTNNVNKIEQLKKEILDIKTTTDVNSEILKDDLIPLARIHISKIHNLQLVVKELIDAVFGESYNEYLKGKIEG